MKKYLITGCAGFAHGLLVLSDVTEFCYKCDDFYQANDEGRFVWNDSEIGTVWPYVEDEYHGTGSSIGYCIDGVELNLSEKNQNWFGLKDTFKF